MNPIQSIPEDQYPASFLMHDEEGNLRRNLDNFTAEDGVAKCRLLSRTQAGNKVTYWPTLDLQTGKLHCRCKGFWTHGHCWHSDRLHEYAQRMGLIPKENA